MDYEFFKIAGAIAGIGGLGLAGVVYIFREVIRKEIFPQLTKGQAYRLLNRIIILIFVIGILGIIAYLIVNWQNGNHQANNYNQNPNANNPTPTPTPAATTLSGIVLDQNERPIPGATVTIDEVPGMKGVETSTDGVFSIKDIPRSYGEAVRIRVAKPGYAVYTEDVVLGKAPPRVRLRRTK